MSELPRISNEVSFEEFCKDLWKDILKDYIVERYGTRGQSQDGVDVACISKDEIIGIQCKRVETLTKSKIDTEINLAKNFEPKLDKYIIATTLKKDKNLQTHVYNRSIENEHNGLFKIEIIFWDGLIDKIFNESSIDLFKKYFPEQSLDVSEISQMLNYISTQFKEMNYKTVENSLNFIKESINIKTDKNKYELYILEGKYLSLCRKFKKAGEKYIKAYAVSSKDIKSKYYYALGLFYNENIKESKNICNEILKEDSLNQYAYSILVLIDKDTKIPQELIDSPQINYNLGINAQLDKDYKKAYNFFKKSNLNYSIRLLNRANIRLFLFDESEEYPFNIDLKDYNKNLKIEKIFQEIFDKFTDEILSNYFDIFPNLLALNKAHKHFDALERNVNRLLSINSDDENTLFYKSVLLERKGDVDKALDILKKIPKVLDSFIFIVKILMDKKDTNQVIKYAECMYNDIDKNSKNYLFCQDVLINSYIEVERIEDAETIIGTIDDIFRRNLFKSKLYNDKSEKMNYLLRCYENYGNAFIIDKAELAREFSYLNEFEKAITIYESFIDLNRHSPILDDLAYCYLYNEDYGKLISLVHSFIIKEKPHKYLIEYGIEGYLHLNKFREAKELMEIYSEEFNENYSIELAKAKIDFINGNYKEVDDFLDEKHDLKNLSPSQCISLYGLLKNRNSNPIKSFELLYTIKKIHSQDLMVHKVYIQEFNDKNFTFINPVRIKWDDYVLIEYLDKIEWLHICKQDRDKTKFHEFEKIINHKANEEIEINPNFKIKILKIRNKYTHEFHESANTLRMNNSNFLQVIEFKNPSEGVEKIKELALKRSDELITLKRKYHEELCPIFVFSKMAGLDMIDSCIYLRSSGLKSFNQYENNHIPIKEDLLLDITSILTIHWLKIEDMIMKNYSLKVSYAEYFLLKEIQELEKNPNYSKSIVATSDEEFELIETNNSKFIFVSQLIEWIDENCELISLNPKSKIRKTLRGLPKPINENIQLAFEGNLLICDDLDFKKVILHDFKINSCSTLTLIYDMYEKKLINDENFEELLSKLYELNYIEVPITLELIVKFIKKGNYNVLIKLIREVSFNPKKYLHVNWRYIIKNLDLSNVEEYVLFLLIKNTFSELDFNTYINPLDIEIKEFFDNIKFVASKNSEVYHNVNCSFIKKISENNLIYFANEQDALSKGYVKCDKC